MERNRGAGIRDGAVPPHKGTQGAALLVTVRAELGARYMEVCFIIRLHNSHIYLYIFLYDQLFYNKIDQRIFGY